MAGTGIDGSGILNSIHSRKNKNADDRIKERAFRRQDIMLLLYFLIELKIAFFKIKPKIKIS